MFCNRWFSDDPKEDLLGYLPKRRIRKILGVFSKIKV
jgi:hypothetical protein